MAGSLQDQLLGSGLIKKQKARNIQTAKKKAVKQSRANNTQLVDEAAEFAKKAQDEQRRKSQELNKQYKQEAEQKAILAQIRQIIQLNSIEKYPKKMDQDVLQSYNFSSGKKIKSMLVSPQNHELISRGRIAIALLLENQEESFYLIPVEAAHKISERNTDAIVLLNDASSKNSNDSVDEDPYADFEVPDDLMW